MSDQIKAYIFLEDGGDGSAIVRYFPSEEVRDEYAEGEDQRFCDDTYEETFTVVDGVLKPTSGWDDE